MLDDLIKLVQTDYTKTHTVSNWKYEPSFENYKDEDTRIFSISFNDEHVLFSVRRIMYISRKNFIRIDLNDKPEHDYYFQQSLVNTAIIYTQFLDIIELHKYVISVFMK